MTDPVKRRKPGPDPERLKIEGDPRKALRKLLSTPPHEKDGEPERERPEGDDEGQD